ncbi:MAG: aryl-alcohol dehydrogenase-like predicted oxidoreductase [Enterobacterales bacterium]
MKLALGTVQFSQNYGIANKRGMIPYNEVQEILKYSNEAGINTLDTAISYGDCETILGSVGVDSWQVISKLPEIPLNCNDIKRWIVETVKSSLNKLNVPQLHALLLHRPKLLLEDNGDIIYQTLNELKEKKLIKNIGISIYEANELESIINNYKVDIVQVPFNLMDHRLIESGLLAKMASSNIEVHVRSIFLQGLLLMNNENRPKKFNFWKNNWNKYDQWLKVNGLTPLQACLKFVSSFSEIEKIVVGVDHICHIKQIVEAYKVETNLTPVRFNSDDLNLLNPSNWINIK